MKPGEIIAAKGDIEINADKKSFKIEVTNSGDRPIQVGSHFHFFEVNSRLKFDRAKAYGYRLDIPAGTAVRFQPLEVKTVSLVEISGKKKVMGCGGLVNGFLSERKDEAISALSTKKEK